MQQIQQQMDQRQEVFSQLQDRLNAENAARDNAARVPVAVPVPPPAYQDRVSCQDHPSAMQDQLNADSQH